jgi:transcriptional regulator with PAS, ATPase and Fis domain
VIGKIQAFAACIARAKKAEVTERTVLITAESGTVKEVIAKFIHDLTLRKEKNYNDDKSGAIPENFVESELFGH